MKLKQLAFLAVIAAGLTACFVSVAKDVKTFSALVMVRAQKELTNKGFQVELPEDGLASDILSEILKHKPDWQEKIAYLFILQNPKNDKTYVFSGDKVFSSMPKRSIDLMNKKVQNKSLKSLGISKGRRIFVVLKDKPAKSK